MAKSFQDRIKDIQDYHPDISYKDGAFIIKITFNEHWQIIKPKDKDVGYAPDDSVKTLHWYASTIEHSDKLFDLIDETITLNKEFEKKTTLYKQKVKELQKLFLSDISYEKLKSIHFVVEDKETKPKAKKNVQKTPKSNKAATRTETEPEKPEEPVDNKEIDTTQETEAGEEYKGDIDNAIEQALNSEQ